MDRASLWYEKGSYVQPAGRVPTLVPLFAIHSGLVFPKTGLFAAQAVHQAVVVKITVHGSIRGVKRKVSSDLSHLAR